jgi:hypothetical protein
VRWFHRGDRLKQDLTVVTRNVKAFEGLGVAIFNSPGLTRSKRPVEASGSPNCIVRGDANGELPLCTNSQKRASLNSMEPRRTFAQYEEYYLV